MVCGMPWFDSTPTAFRLQEPEPPEPGRPARVLLPSEVETSEPEPTPPKDPDMDAYNLVHRVCMQLNETKNWCSRACSGV